MTGPVIRVGHPRDIARLMPRTGPRQARVMMRQARESRLFALDVAGEVIAAGGLWPYPDGETLEAWMLTRLGARLPPRALAQAAAMVLATVGSGETVICHVGQDRPRHRRFVEFLGFNGLRAPPSHMFGRAYDALEWRPITDG